jgi:drug/metabolite transporter (DMT)-like permease
LVGVFTQLGQLFLTYGYKELPATKAAPISYVQVLFATIIGIFYFDEIIDINFIIGSVIVHYSIKMVISNEFNKK